MAFYIIYHGVFYNNLPIFSTDFSRRGMGAMYWIVIDFTRKIELMAKNIRIYKKRDEVDKNLISITFFSLAAGIIYGVVQDYELDACVKAGLLGAYKSLSSYSAISSEICPDLLSIDSVQQWAPFNPEYL